MPSLQFVKILGNVKFFSHGLKLPVDWQAPSGPDGVRTPGLPLYPAFAMFPGPMAPPMPNIPVPLISCPSAMMSRMADPSQMANEMKSALDGGLKKDDKDKHHEALFDALATVISLAFMIWLPSQQMMTVMGEGQIPTFAPPFVPAGAGGVGGDFPRPGGPLAGAGRVRGPG